MLARMLADLEKVRLYAIPFGKADIYNVCGSRGNNEEIYSMSIPLALGGIGFQIRDDLHPANKKAK